ncbi:MAG: ABC transporter substrate-binding protein [Xanthobacteraceae bacterium]
MAIDRRLFLKGTAGLTTAGALIGSPMIHRRAHAEDTEFTGTIKAGHLVGICMSPVFMADAAGFFKEEGLKVDLTWMPNPGDSVAALTSGAVQFIHNPFTTTYVAVSKGSPLKIISGSGAGGLVVIAQKDTGLKSMADLKSKVGKGFKVGSQRTNTLELTFYRNLTNAGMKYSDFDMVYFSDHFSMAAAFETKAIDLVTHVEPYSTKLVDKFGGVPLATNIDAWGENAPDCVVSVRQDFLDAYPGTVKKYLNAILKADKLIKSDMLEAAKILDKGKYYKVDFETLKAALPRQKPQVDLVAAAKGMDIAIGDMVTLGYLKKAPENVTDFTILKTVV